MKSLLTLSIISFIGFRLAFSSLAHTIEQVNDKTEQRQLAEISQFN